MHKGEVIGCGVIVVVIIVVIVKISEAPERALSSTKICRINFGEKLTLVCKWHSLQMSQN